MPLGEQETHWNFPSGSKMYISRYPPVGLEVSFAAVTRARWFPVGETWNRVIGLASGIVATYRTVPG